MNVEAVAGQLGERRSRFALSPARSLDHGARQHQQRDGAGVWCVDRRPGRRRITSDHGGPERQHDAGAGADESANAALKSAAAGVRK